MLSLSPLIVATGFVYDGQSYYTQANAKSGQSLKTALFGIIGGPKVLHRVLCEAVSAPVKKPKATPYAPLLPRLKISPRRQGAKGEKYLFYGNKLP